ncbi:MAG TPA: hypothetical protein VHL11_13200 [Phototrophicaceae bacterium]|nr:hypothetical protein [Phototrophicaceae bacterium]
MTDTADIAAWVQQYDTCPDQIRRAVLTLASGYQLLNSEFLPFGVNDVSTFNTSWKWYQGSSGSAVHTIDIATNTLTLIADSMTDQRDTITTAPVLAYPATGDIVAQVQLTFTPLDDKNGAGIGIRAAQDFNSWIRIARVGDNIEVVADNAGTSTVVESLPYAEGEPKIYLKIERVATQFTLSYSVDGDDWHEIVSDYSLVLPQETEVYLTTFWPVESAAAIAGFAEMKVNAG